MAIGSEAVPQIQSDLAKAKADYARDGYCIIPDVLSKEQVSALRQRVMAQADAERALGWARMDQGAAQLKRAMADLDGLVRARVTETAGGVNQRIGFLVNKGKVFRELITHPVTLALVEHVLGGHYILSSFTANIVNQGGVLEDLHRDSWWVPVPFRKGERYTPVGDRKRNTEQADSGPADIVMPPCVCNVVWMITDFTEENGGTRLVPGSHLRSENPPASVPHKVPTIAAVGKAGSCLMWDGRMWHATGKNQTNDPRIALLTTFNAPLIRQHENYFLALDPAVYDEASDKLLDILGYSSWFFFGRGDALSDNKRLRVREPWITEMTLR